MYAQNAISGEKDSESFETSGLVRRSQSDNGEGIIYVALNHRLGLFGWANGRRDGDIFPNVGLQDQPLGLKW